MSGLIHQHLETQARTRPDAMAVSYQQEHLDFAGLNRRAEQLATFLNGVGVGRGDRVGIYMGKCLEVPVALYGILKAGAAYVPLDPSAPTARTAQIVRDCDISVVASAANNRSKLTEISALADCLDNVIGPSSEEADGYTSLSWTSLFERTRAKPLQLNLNEDDLAYIIFTSGSTGRPKGITHTHRSCLAFASWAANEYGLFPSDRLSNHAPLHFDLSIFDYFAAIVAGAATVIVPEEHTRLPASYSQLLEDQGVTVLFTVPFALIQLSLRGVLEQRDLSALRWVIFGGEPMSTKYLRQLMKQLPEAVFDNMYGPAEINGVSHFTVTAAGVMGESIPIGPINRISHALVVDTNNESVAVGETGELLVSTPSMMQGYWHLPQLNQKAFFRVNECRYYRTGDMVRREEDGTMWFIGRRDRQLKIRGYRVELDEIEATLKEHHCVVEAGAYPVPGPDGQFGIEVAVTLNRPGTTDESELLRFLKRKMSWYAIPTAIDVRGQLPRTTSGKVDRRALSGEAGG